VLKRLIIPALALVALALLPLRAAQAHGFGDRYDLPIPLSFFAAGAALAVVLSFVFLGGVVKETAARWDYPRLDLFKYSWANLLLGKAAPLLLKPLGVLTLALVVAAGLFGALDPSRNFAPPMVWVIWWVGLSFVTALLGNLWETLNPWKTLFGWAEAVYRRLRPGKTLGLVRDYPMSWGVWPAVALFFAFTWVENAFGESASPQFLAWMVLAYSAVTWTGMFIFGKRQWLRSGEAFAVVFSLISRFAITEVRVTDPEVCRRCSGDCRDLPPTQSGCVNCYECFSMAPQGQLNLRPPAVGLHHSGPATADQIPGSMLALVVLLLATVTFDGFSATPEWAVVQLQFLINFPRVASGLFSGAVVADTLGLLAVALVFAGLYWGFCYLMHQTVGRRTSVDELVRAFAYSLIPIALAYQFAHYLSFLLIQGQQIIPLVSDPFGRGWDLLGTAGYKVNIRIVNARFVWIFAVLSIVAGHIVAVYLAHLRSLVMYSDRRLALQSQLPLLGLMVGYTVISLWIVSRPITS